MPLIAPPFAEVDGSSGHGLGFGCGGILHLVCAGQHSRHTVMDPFCKDADIPRLHVPYFQSRWHNLLVSSMPFKIEWSRLQLLCIVLILSITTVAERG